MGLAATMAPASGRVVNHHLMLVVESDPLSLWLCVETVAVLSEGTEAGSGGGGGSRAAPFDTVATAIEVEACLMLKEFLH